MLYCLFQCYEISPLCDRWGVGQRMYKRILVNNWACRIGTCRRLWWTAILLSPSQAPKTSVIILAKRKGSEAECKVVPLLRPELTYEIATNPSATSNAERLIRPHRNRFTKKTSASCAIGLQLQPLETPNPLLPLPLGSLCLLFSSAIHVMSKVIPK